MPEAAKKTDRSQAAKEDESVLTDGKIDPAKLKPITFDPVNNAYPVLGEKVGNAFRDGLKLSRT